MSLPVAMAYVVQYDEIHEAQETREETCYCRLSPPLSIHQILVNLPYRYPNLLFSPYTYYCILFVDKDLYQFDKISKISKRKILSILI